MGFSTLSELTLTLTHAPRLGSRFHFCTLVLTDKVRQALKIFEGDALSVYLDQLGMRGSLDVVVANTPFVSVDALADERKELLLEALGNSVKGKTDLYLGILQAGIDFLKRDGSGLFVLPKSFLISENAAPVRENLLENAVLHCVVDLSAVRVFEQVGAYVILLIFEKQVSTNSNRAVQVVQCTDLAGAALEDALQDREVRTPAYEVYWSAQPRRGGDSWEFSVREKIALQSKLARHATLSEVAEVRQGMVTGMDDVFFRPSSAIPKRERAAYLRYLADREIEPYKRISPTQKRYVIYPFRGDDPLGEDDFADLFPQTWAYLLDHRAALSSRRSVLENNGIPWWRENDPVNRECFFARRSSRLISSSRLALRWTLRVPTLFRAHAISFRKGQADRMSSYISSAC